MQAIFGALVAFPATQRLFGGPSKAKAMWKWHRLGGYLLVLLLFTTVWCVARYGVTADRTASRSATPTGSSRCVPDIARLLISQHSTFEERTTACDERALISLTEQERRPGARYHRCDRQVIAVKAAWPSLLIILCTPSCTLFDARRRSALAPKAESSLKHTWIRLCPLLEHMRVSTMVQVDSLSGHGYRAVNIESEWVCGIGHWKRSGGIQADGRS